MGLPQSPATTPHLYSPSLQLKLYQAFIFSIPILFSIILFLLFYLFYLKRRISSSSLPISATSRSPTQGVSSNSLALMGLKGILKDKLPVLIFDSNLRMKETQCCVCLGEFELKEELHQLPLCQHVFHKECIRHWFNSSSTCPLCRCPVLIINSKIAHQHPPPNGSTVTIVLQDDNNNNENINSNSQEHVQAHEQLQEHVAYDMASISNCQRENQMGCDAEGSSSRVSTTSIRSEDSSCSIQPESVIVNIHLQES